MTSPLRVVLDTNLGRSLAQNSSSQMLRGSAQACRDSGLVRRIQLRTCFSRIFPGSTAILRSAEVRLKSSADSILDNSSSSSCCLFSSSLESPASKSSAVRFRDCCLFRPQIKIIAQTSLLDGCIVHHPRIRRFRRHLMLPHTRSQGALPRLRLKPVSHTARD